MGILVIKTILYILIESYQTKLCISGGGLNLKIGKVYTHEDRSV